MASYLELCFSVLQMLTMIKSEKNIWQFASRETLDLFLNWRWGKQIFAQTKQQKHEKIHKFGRKAHENGKKGGRLSETAKTLLFSILSYLSGYFEHNIPEKKLI